MPHRFASQLLQRKLHTHLEMCTCHSDWSSVLLIIYLYPESLLSGCSINCFKGSVVISHYNSFYVKGKCILCKYTTFPIAYSSCRLILPLLSIPTKFSSFKNEILCPLNSNFSPRWVSPIRCWVFMHLQGCVCVSALYEGQRLILGSFLCCSPLNSLPLNLELAGLTRLASSQALGVLHFNQDGVTVSITCLLLHRCGI